MRNYKNTATTQNQESKKNDDNTITSDYLSSCFTAVCGVVLHKDNFSTVSGKTVGVHILFDFYNLVLFSSKLMHCTVF